jgi:hypothetical protein
MVKVTGCDESAKPSGYPYLCSHRATKATSPTKPAATKMAMSQPSVSAGISNIPAELPKIIEKYEIFSWCDESAR